MAKAAEDYFGGSARKAETYLGWKRQAVQRGLYERRLGVTCLDNYQARGAKKTEEKLPALASDIHELLDGAYQAEEQLKTTFKGVVKNRVTLSIKISSRSHRLSGYRRLQ